MHTDLYKQNESIIHHLATVASDNNLNYFVTISFVYSKYDAPLRKHDVSSVRSLVGAYSNRLSSRMFGKSRSSDKKPRSKVPIIAWPEYQSQTSNAKHLHYHCLIKVSPDKRALLEHVTNAFWMKTGIAHYGWTPEIDITDAYDIRGAALYSGKFIEDGFTIENLVVRGLIFDQG